MSGRPMPSRVRLLSLFVEQLGLQLLTIVKAAVARPLSGRGVGLTDHIMNEREADGAVRPGLVTSAE